MAGTLDFIFDFASPNAYLAWRALPPMLQRTGATVALKPCLLGGIFKATGNQAPMTAFGAVRASWSTRCWRRAASSPPTG